MAQESNIMRDALYIVGTNVFCNSIFILKIQFCQYNCNTLTQNYFCNTIFKKHATIHLVTMFNRNTNTLWFKLESSKISIVEMNDVFWEYTNERIAIEKVYKHTNNEFFNKYCLSDYLKYNWHYKISN